jgi:DNA adenine methylase
MLGLLRYPGGKHKIRNRILAPMLAYCAKQEADYREPFFGGGSIGLDVLAAAPIRQAWLNDADVALIALWRAVQSHPQELCERILDFQPSTDAFHRFRQELRQLSLRPVQAEIPSHDGLAIGFCKLALHQISYSGLGTMADGPLGGNGQKSIYHIGSRWNPQSLCRKVQRYHALLAGKGKAVRFSSEDFAALFREPGRKTLFYCDPPYYQAGHRLYQYHFTEADHERLARVLQKTVQPWLCSYDDCEPIRALYRFASVRTVTVQYNVIRGRGTRRAGELLIAPRTCGFLLEAGEAGSKMV